MALLSSMLSVSDQLATPIGHFLLQLRWILKPLTFAVLGFEFIGPLLLFSPIWKGPVRSGAVFALFSMLVGFGLCLVIGIFVWTAAFAVLGLFPPWFWENIQRRRWRKRDKQAVRIYYRPRLRFLYDFDSSCKGALTRSAYPAG